MEAAITEITLEPSLSAFIIGSITSRCSGNEPALLSRMHERVGSISAKSGGNRAHFYHKAEESSRGVMGTGWGAGLFERQAKQIFFNHNCQ